MTSAITKAATFSGKKHFRPVVNYISKTNMDRHKNKSKYQHEGGTTHCVVIYLARLFVWEQNVKNNSWASVNFQRPDYTSNNVFGHNTRNINVNTEISQYNQFKIGNLERYIIINTQTSRRGLANPLRPKIRNIKLQGRPYAHCCSGFINIINIVFVP